MRPRYLSQSYSSAGQQSAAAPRGATLPRRGLLDPTWPYRAAVATNVAETIENERRRLALLPPAPRFEPAVAPDLPCSASAPVHDDCAQIARYPGTPGRIRGWLLAVAIGLGLALATVHWWTT